MNQYLITALINFALAVFALKKRNDLAAKALAYTLFCASAWAVELYLLSTLEKGELLDTLFHLTRCGMFLIPPCFALLTWRLVGGRSPYFLNMVVRPVFLLSFLLGVSNLFFFRTPLVATEAGFLPKIDGIYYAFIVSFFWSFIGALSFSLLSYKSSTNREKQRLKWLLITLVTCFIGGATNLFFMPHDFYLSRYVGSAINIVFVALLFYSTIQHHLMDIRLALSVGLSRVILLGFAVWFLYWFMSTIGQLEQSSPGFFVLAIVLVVMLEVYPRLLQWLLPNAKKLFDTDGYDYEKTRSQFRDTLHEIVSLADLVRVLDYYLLQILKIDNYSIALVESDSTQAMHAFGERNQSKNLFLIKSDNTLLSYCKGKESIVLSDEATIEFQEEVSRHNALISFNVEHESESNALVLVGASKGFSYYRYDDIRMFEWLRQELGPVIHRISQLVQMQNQLGEAKKTLSMLGVMNHYHHDIKAPLAIIDGVLSNDIYDKEKQKDIVLQQVERGSRLIATMAGILKGERKRKIQAVSLHEIVQDSLFLFGLSSNQVTYSFSENIPSIRGDSEDLKILVINIIKNALEAKRDNVLLHITIKTYINDKHVCLSFADTGKGMPSHQLSNLWAEFTTSKEYGSGIGLQAIKRIADEHFAEIDVHSELGKGTEFTFKFPVSIAIEDTQDKLEETVFSKKDKSINKPLAG